MVIVKIFHVFFLNKNRIISRRVVEKFSIIHLLLQYNIINCFSMYLICDLLRERNENNRLERKE